MSMLIDESVKELKYYQFHSSFNNALSTLNCHMFVLALHHSLPSKFCKKEKVHSISECFKMANSADQDQSTPKEQSDHGLTVFAWPFYHCIFCAYGINLLLMTFNKLY